MAAERDDLVPIFIGDDVTDEDAFEAISDIGVSVVVCTEQKPTVADFRLEDSREVADFLAMLAAWQGT